MGDIFKDFGKYLKFPEMKIFWLFLLLLIGALVINIKYIDNAFWLAISSIVLIVTGFVVFLTSLLTAKSHLATKLERNRLNSVILSMNDGIVVYDPNFKVMIFNRAAETIFKLPIQNIVGRTITPSDIKTSALRVLAQVMFPSLAANVLKRTETDVYPQITDISFEDVGLELRITTNRLIDDEGNVFGFLKIINDRTREVGLLKSKSDFITIAAHKLRTPLTAVGWSLEGLKKENLTQSQKDYVEMGLGASNVLLKVVEDLLSASKVEEGKFGYELQNVDLVQFLQVILSEAQTLAKNYKINLYFQPPEVPVAVRIDPRKLGMALTYLLDNSIRYNVSNGEVIVSVKKLTDKPYVLISIADTGIGIPPNEIKNVFTKFFRGSNVLTKETEGGGLSLYITKNIIQSHGGEIWAESALERGTTFNFTLPTDFNLIPAKEVGARD